MPEIRYTEKAVFDLDDIYAFIAVERNSPDYARRFLLELRDTIDFLADFPYMGVERGGWKIGLRALMHGNYVILYSLTEEDTEDTVLIERILEGHRDIEGEYRE